MAAPAKVNQYLNTHYEGMDPEQLILMLYKGALDRIKLTREGVEENNPQKRGENLSRVIAIISELNSSLDPLMTDEGTEFLRGLYTSILTELPKVAINNDIEILDRTERYIVRLMEIWTRDVIGASKNSEATKQKGQKVQEAPGKPNKPASPYGAKGYGGGSQSRLTSFSV